MRIEVLPGVPKSLGDVTDRVGSTQVSVVSRLLKWFATQPDVTQATVLGLCAGDTKKELPKMIIKGMTAE